MQKTKLIRRHKLMLAARGYKPENWYLERETATLLYIISKNGQRRVVPKEQAGESEGRNNGKRKFKAVSVLRCG